MITLTYDELVVYRSRLKALLHHGGLG